MCILFSTVVNTSVENVEKCGIIPEVSTGKREMLVEKPVEIVENYSSSLWITGVIHGKQMVSVKKIPSPEGKAFAPLLGRVIAKQPGET